MTQQERKEILQKARELAREEFNSLPFEIRKKLANGYDRLLELDLLLSSGDSLCMLTLKDRKREVEDWLLEWYRVQEKE